MFIVCGRGNLAAAFYLDKKCSNVQVGAKLAVSPPGIFFSRMFKKQAVDLGLYRRLDFFSRLPYNSFLPLCTFSNQYVRALNNLKTERRNNER